MRRWWAASVITTRCVNLIWTWSSSITPAVQVACERETKQKSCCSIWHHPLPCLYALVHEERSWHMLILSFWDPCLFSPSKHLRIALMVSGERPFLLSQRTKAFLLKSMPKIYYYGPSCLCKYTYITYSSTSSYHMHMLQWKMSIVKGIRMHWVSFVAVPCIVLKSSINASILLHFSSAHFNQLSVL